jgi:dTDP-4-dehydrorhamnose reductase
MTIAILGANGQLGGELRHRLGSRAAAYSRQEVDIADGARIDAALSQCRPDAVVNCAAYNAVDLAESEPETAFRVNALGPRCLAEWCRKHNIPLLHVSTDYVFGLDAQRATPYRETDLPGPLGVYAITKLAGEEFVRAGCARHFIVRTCGLYGHRRESGKRNFVDTMLLLSGAGENLASREPRIDSRPAGPEHPPVAPPPCTIRVVCDQRCTPTSTSDLAEAIVRLLSTDAYGTYHATNAGDCSWAEFATEIFRLANVPTAVVPITTAEYGAKAPRPAYSVLDCGKLTGVLGRPLRPWQEALADYLMRRFAGAQDHVHRIEYDRLGSKKTSHPEM